MLAFRSAHECIESSWKPAGHQSILDRHSGNLCISQTLRDEHDTQRQASDNVVGEPSWVVSWQPSDNRDLVQDVIRCCSRQSACSSSTEGAGFVPSDISRE